MWKCLLVAATAILSFDAALADGVDDRQTFQYGQIEQGRQDGSITWTEGLRLRSEQVRITRLKAELSLNGVLPAVNRPALYKLQDEAAEHIENAIDGGPRRLSGLPRVGR